MEMIRFFFKGGPTPRSGTIKTDRIMKVNENKKSGIRHSGIVLTAGMIIGAAVTCCDGIMLLFGTDRWPQYLWNFFFLFMYVPFCIHMYAKTIGMDVNLREEEQP